MRLLGLYAIISVSFRCISWFFVAIVQSSHVLLQLNLRAVLEEDMHDVY